MPRKFPEVFRHDVAAVQEGNAFVVDQADDKTTNFGDRELARVSR